MAHKGKQQSFDSISLYQLYIKYTMKCYISQIGIYPVPLRIIFIFLLLFVLLSSIILLDFNGEIAYGLSLFFFTLKVFVVDSERHICMRFRLDM